MDKVTVAERKLAGLCLKCGVNNASKNWTHKYVTKENSMLYWETGEIKWTYERGKEHPGYCAPCASNLFDK